MTLQNRSARGLALRAPDGWSISEGLPERRNAVGRSLAALLSWLSRLRRPPDLPDYLRRDVGVEPDHPVRHIPPYPAMPDYLRLDRW
jgi:hypothetical protein